MKYQSRIMLRREGWYYLTVWVFVLSGASLRHINLLMVIAGMMLGPVLINLLAVFRSLRGVEVSRNCPRRITAGQPLSVAISVKRPAKSRRLGIFRCAVDRAVIVEDTIRRISPRTDQRECMASVMFTSLAAGQQETLHYMGRIRQRGHYELGPLKISTSWPFGLFVKTVIVPDRRELVVYPRPGRLAPRWHQVMREAHAGTTYTRGRLGQQEGDFYGLRDWREGDSRRWIHWRTSARRGALFVRQFEQSRSQDLILLVDLRQPPHSTRQHAARVEKAIAFAATIVGNVCARGGGQLTVASIGTEVERFEGPASTLLLSDLLSHFAWLEAGTEPALDETNANAGADWAETRLAALIEAGLQGVTRRRNVLLISTRAVNRDDLDQAARTREAEVLSAIGRCLCVSTDDVAFHTYFDTEALAGETSADGATSIVQSTS
jgi:uncharacterized protein (DUF58 family)